MGRFTPGVLPQAGNPLGFLSEGVDAYDRATARARLEDSQMADVLGKRRAQTLLQERAAATLRSLEQRKGIEVAARSGDARAARAAEIQRAMIGSADSRARDKMDYAIALLRQYPDRNLNIFGGRGDGTLGNDPSSALEGVAEGYWDQYQSEGLNTRTKNGGNMSFAEYATNKAAGDPQLNKFFSKTGFAQMFRGAAARVSSKRGVASDRSNVSDAQAASSRARAAQLLNDGGFPADAASIVEPRRTRPMYPSAPMPQMAPDAGEPDDYSDDPELEAELRRIYGGKP